MYVCPCSRLVLGGRMTVQPLEITCGFLVKIRFFLHGDALNCSVFCFLSLNLVFCDK